MSIKQGIGRNQLQVFLAPGISHSVLSTSLATPSIQSKDGQKMREINASLFSIFKMMKWIYILIAVFGATGCSGFYVKVIDQYGNPVPDVSVRVGTITTMFITAGSRIDFYTTNSDGRFKLGGPRVGIELIEKNGYEFSSDAGFGSTSIYGAYDGWYSIPQYKETPNSYSNPYYILAWKRESLEPLIGNQRLSGVTLESNDDFYQIYFMDEDILLREKEYKRAAKPIKASLLVRYKESEKIVLNRQSKEMHPWELTLEVPGGGLIETDDIIRNLAPEKGYKQQWTISSSDLPEIDRQFTRRFYIKAHDGQIYGQFIFKFRPGFRSLAFKPYWFNYNASRNLTRPKRYVYCNNQFLPRNCSLDDYGP